MKVNKFSDENMVTLKLVHLKRITDGGLGAEPPVAKGYGCPGAKPLAAGRLFVIF